MSNLINHTVSLLGGVGVGAVAMFLLDPDKGSYRRQEIASNTGQALSSTQDALHATLSNAGQYAQQAAGHIRDQVGNTADDVSDRTQSVAGQARKAARNVFNAARGYAGDASDYASSTARKARAKQDDLMDSAKATYARARSSVSQVADDDDSHPYLHATEITAGTLGVLAIGAGAMYLFDPARGASRRATLRNQVFSWTRRTGNSARRYGRHFGNQMKGVSHNIGKATGEWMPQSSMPTESSSTPSGAVSH